LSGGEAGWPLALHHHKHASVIQTNLKLHALDKIHAPLYALPSHSPGDNSSCRRQSATRTSAYRTPCQTSENTTGHRSQGIIFITRLNLHGTNVN
jgi:hypothetical protein